MTDNNELKGLGGWLILVGFGVVVSPIIMLVTLIPAYKPILGNGVWEALTTKGSEEYIPYVGYLLAGEIVFNTIMLAASICLIYFFFSKHYFFPRLYIFIVAASLVFIPMSSWFVSKVIPGEPVFSPEAAKEFLQLLIVGVIWIPYMLLSKRVKVTFVENMPNKNQTVGINYDSKI